MEQRTLGIFIAKNITYTLLIVACYILQETPFMLTFWVAQPVLVIAAVVPIAMIEGELSGGLFGLFAGFLCDISASHIFGVSSICFLIFGTVCGLLIIYLMQANKRALLLLTFSFATLYGLICYYITYGIWNYAGSSALILFETIPNALLTTIWVIPIHYIIIKIYRAFPMP